MTSLLTCLNVDTKLLNEDLCSQSSTHGTNEYLRIPFTKSVDDTQPSEFKMTMRNGILFISNLFPIFITLRAI